MPVFQGFCEGELFGEGAFEDAFDPMLDFLLCYNYVIVEEGGGILGRKLLCMVERGKRRGCTRVYTDTLTEFRVILLGHDVWLIDDFLSVRDRIY